MDAYGYKTNFLREGLVSYPDSFLEWIVIMSENACDHSI